MLGWGHYLLGFVNYEWNDLETAARHFEQVAGMYFTTLFVIARNGQIGQALVHQALGAKSLPWRRLTIWARWTWSIGAGKRLIQPRAGRGYCSCRAGRKWPNGGPI
jgi:hypothetical protein